MNIHQLEYIVAVDKFRQFGKAAEACFVTQPTLSMMVQKMEQEIGLKIFDRKSIPITVTKEGEEVIERAKKILSEVRLLKEFSKEIKGEISGELKIGIIPTLAPYLLPLFLKNFAEAFPALKLSVKEMMTHSIIENLNKGDLDIALLATPLNEKGMKELHLFKEAFYAYGSVKKKGKRDKYILPSQLQTEHLWLLEEGHCFRNQVMNFCELQKSTNHSSITYEAGSIETLINLVDQYEGITIIPELAIKGLKKNQTEKVMAFAKPYPTRQISMVIQENYPRLKIVDALRDFILKVLPFSIDEKNKSVININ